MKIILFITSILSVISGLHCPPSEVSSHAASSHAVSSAASSCDDVSSADSSAAWLNHLLSLADGSRTQIDPAEHVRKLKCPVKMPLLD